MLPSFLLTICVVLYMRSRIHLMLLLQWSAWGLLLLLSGTANPCFHQVTCRSLLVDLGAKNRSLHHCYSHDINQWLPKIQVSMVTFLHIFGLMRDLHNAIVVTKASSVFVLLLFCWEHRYKHGDVTSMCLACFINKWVICWVLHWCLWHLIDCRSMQLTLPAVGRF